MYTYVRMYKTLTSLDPPKKRDAGCVGTGYNNFQPPTHEMRIYWKNGADVKKVLTKCIHKCFHRFTRFVEKRLIIAMLPHHHICFEKGSMYVAVWFKQVFFLFIILGHIEFRCLSASRFLRGTKEDLQSLICKCTYISVASLKGKANCTPRSIRLGTSVDLQKVF